MLTRLRLTGYRNLEDTHLEFPPEGVALVGANAQGKTNLLEAIHYLEIFRSFRGTRDSRIIRFGEDVFRVEGVVGDRTVAAAYQRRGQVKKVTVDGEEPARLGDAIGQVAAVLFTPEDVRIVSDGPDERRRFLDILLSLNVPGYLEALQRFRQALSQRNRALREGSGRGAIEAWNGALARSGGKVVEIRARWIHEVRPRFSEIFAGISGGEEASLEYRGPAEAPPWEEALLEGLLEGFEGDRQMGTTRTGPHRDDFRIHLGAESRDLRHYGSGGQRRTGALVLRILEAETVRRRRERDPILLLDDVFAELDRDRSVALIDLLERTAAGQVILTAPKEADLSFRADRLARWSIHDGVIDG